MHTLILANSSSAVSWTIVTGIATIAIGLGGYAWLKQRQKNIPGLLSIAALGVAILLYGWWGTTSTTTFYYSIYFFVFPVAAAGIVFKAANTTDAPLTPTGNEPRLPNSPLFERSARIQSSPGRSLYADLAAAVQKDAMRDMLGLRLGELERFMGEGFHPTQWCFVGTELIATDGATVAYAGRNGVEKLDAPLSIERHESGRVQALRFGDKTFSPVRPEANVKAFVHILTNTNESSSNV